MFIKQIFYGVMRYLEFLKVCTENLFANNKATTDRKDENLYHIFAYLAIFRLDELPIDDFKHFVNVKLFNKNTKKISCDFFYKIYFNK